MGLRVALLGAALACLATGAEAAQTKISMIIYTAPGVPFFNPLIKGAQDAAKEADVDLDIQYANNDQVLQNNIIQTAVANKVDGIATVIWDDHAFKKSICDAVHAGIPVIAFNVDNTKGAAASCRLAFIGQDFVTAGYLIGKRMVAAAHLKKGDLVFTPVEFPDAAYATLRHEGVQKALDEVGATSEIVGTGGNLPEVRTKMVQYLIGHSDVRRSSDLASSRMIEALPSLKEAKLKVPVGGFDVSKEDSGRHRKRRHRGGGGSAALFPGLLHHPSARAQNPLWALPLGHEDRRIGSGRQDQLQIRGSVGGTFR